MDASRDATTTLDCGGETLSDGELVLGDPGTLGTRLERLTLIRDQSRRGNHLAGPIATTGGIVRCSLLCEGA